MNKNIIRSIERWKFDENFLFEFMGNPDEIETFNFSSDIQPESPCNPSPCGPNSECRPINGQGVCSCIRGFSGSPPSCRPECVVSTDCPQNEACSNQKCIDPCPGSCGLRAQCAVVGHSPICSCPAGFEGDPFVRCIPKSEKKSNLLLKKC